MNTGVCVILVTAPCGQDAERIAETLVGENLAACVNRVEKIYSTYTWKGEVCGDREDLLIVKTRRDLVPRVIDRVREVHPYDVPEVIALDVTAGSEDYLDWVRTTPAEG